MLIKNSVGTFIAVTETGKRVTIEEALKMPNNTKFYCPICHEELYIMNQDYGISYFMPQDANDCDYLTHDISVWRKEWLYRYPKQYREIPIELIINRDVYIDFKNSVTEYGSNAYNNGKDKNFSNLFNINDDLGTNVIKLVHKADICFGDVVLLFQESDISSQEFQYTNWFFNKAGYIVIWIFQKYEDFKRGNIQIIDNVYNEEKKCEDGTIYNNQFYAKTLLSYIPQNVVLNKNSYELKDMGEVIILLQLQDPMNYTSTRKKGEKYLERLVETGITERNGHVFSNLNKIETKNYPGNWHELNKMIGIDI